MSEIRLPAPPPTFDERGKGTYILILRLGAPVMLTVGRLGTFDLEGGWYAYVGSAMGTGGLRGRLKHHLSPVTKPHWHIDYLRQHAGVHEVWYRADATACEHQWASVLGTLPGACVPVARFGASDCDCPTHLLGFTRRPDFAAWQDRGHPDGAVRRWTVR
jgi:Uri superfamily endonuclease